MQRLQAIEGNPLTGEEVAMFEKSENEGWSHDRRLAHIPRKYVRAMPSEAAE